MGEALLGYCGLYCGGCAFYQGTIAGKPFAGESGETFLCEGCASGKATPWCTDCGIKSCAIDKGFRTCIECADDPCEKMRGFMDQPKYPYHLEVQDNMMRLRDIGFEAWEEEMKRRYVCASCGASIDWFQKACPACGRATD
jgi:hypothetical protein